MGGGLAAGGGGGVAGGDHRLERGAFVLQVALGGLDKVGDQVVAALELDVDLREGVHEAVAQLHETVVGTDDVEHDEGRNGEEDEGRKNHDGNAYGSIRGCASTL